MGEPITLVLISSVFVWSVAENVSGDIYESRDPQSALMKKFKEYEDKVLAFNKEEGSPVKSHVIAAGAFYAGGECHYFENVFKEAWLGKKVALPLASRRGNRVPTVCVFDCARLIKTFAYTMELEKGDKPYMVAVDQAQNTLQELWQGIVNEMTEPYTLSGDATDVDDPTDPLGLADLTFTPDPIMLEDTYTWVAPGGLTVSQNTRKAGVEYTKRNTLQAVRVLILREPPRDAAEKKIFDGAVPKYIDFIAEDFQIKPIKSSKELEHGNTTRYRGYILDEYLGYDDCTKLFTKEIEEEVEDRDAEPVEVADGEESPGGDASPVRTKIVKRTILKECTPDHVIALTAESDLTKKTAETFFQEQADVPVFFMPPKQTPEEVEVQLESIRIYMDGHNRRPDGTIGRPLNYGIKIEQECIEETQGKHAEAARRAEEEGGQVKDAAVNEDNLTEVRKKETKAEKNRWEKLTTLKRREQALKEVAIVDFLQDNVMPTMTEALIAVCKLKPDGPIDYLANFLEAACDAEAAEQAAAAAAK